MTYIINAQVETRINNMNKFVIATTRFNDETWEENKEWRKRHDWKGCVYGTPRRVSETFMPNAPIFVLEMHNDKNKVQGVGLIKNAIVINEYHNIYSDRNYNRYTYKSMYRVDRKEMTPEEKKIIRVFDVVLFTGSTHLKRGQGIIKVPDRITGTKYIDLFVFFKTMFKNRFKSKYETESETECKDLNILT